MDSQGVEVRTADSVSQLKSMAAAFTEQKLHRSLIDVEDHMDCAPGDFRNSAIDVAIRSAV